MNFALKWFVPTTARIPFKNTVQKKKWSKWYSKIKLILCKKINFLNFKVLECIISKIKFYF
jgi:hypothetical protein